MSAAGGARRKRQVKALLEAEGYVVMSATGSSGPADLVAIKAADDGPGPAVRLIDVKSDEAGPYAHFGRERRRQLARLGERLGATPELCWWPSRGTPTWIDWREWPV